MKHHDDPGAPLVINRRRTRNFICLVDDYRPPAMKRRTAGRYRVGAKNPKQARKLLQAAIGFGSVQVFCEDNTRELSDPVPCGQCCRETWDPNARRFVQSETRHISKN